MCALQELSQNREGTRGQRSGALCTLQPERTCTWVLCPACRQNKKKRFVDATKTLLGWPAVPFQGGRANIFPSGADYTPARWAAMLTTAVLGTLLQRIPSNDRFSVRLAAFP